MILNHKFHQWIPTQALLAPTTLALVIPQAFVFETKTQPELRIVHNLGYVFTHVW